jgi:hypothetical protein
MSFSMGIIKDVGSDIAVQSDNNDVLLIPKHPPLPPIVSQIPTPHTPSLFDYE